MPKILLVVDGQASSQIALRHVMELAAKAQSDSVVILNVSHAEPAWPAARVKDQATVANASRQFVTATGPWLNRAGISYETRTCTGDAAQIAAKLAETERCDQIVIAEPPAGRLARLVQRLTGLRAATLLDDILPFAPVPVTVITRRAVDSQRRCHAG